MVKGTEIEDLRIKQTKAHFNARQKLKSIWIEKEKKFVFHHLGSVDPSDSTILRPRVQIPSAKSRLFVAYTAEITLWKEQK